MDSHNQVVALNAFFRECLEGICSNTKTERMVQGVKSVGLRKLVMFFLEG